ncbi:MAG TPA: hypothetical protein VEI26_05030 [Terriglobales bacterium]|nr:hypothetical protein [Terriglobales bacterium]
MLRVNVISIAIGLAFVIATALIRAFYVVWRLKNAGLPSGGAIDIRLLFSHPLLYAVIVFFAGLYVGGRIFH